MLTGYEIKNQINEGNILITDFDESRLNPNSYNLRLGRELLIYDFERAIDPKKENRTKSIEIPESGRTIYPGTLYLGSTMESFSTKKFIPCLSGRSSIGRLGINIHATAGFGDIGFCGSWTLEIFCVQPVILYPGMEIAQMYFFKPDGEDCDNPFIQYTGKYQFDMAVAKSKLYKEYNHEEEEA